MQTRGRCRSRRSQATGRYLVRKRRRSWWSTTGAAIQPGRARGSLWRVSSRWDSTQRASALVGCRGSPGSNTHRTGPDRRGDRDTQKQSIQIQQTEGTSMAHAGDGRPEVYLIVQSKQIHAGLGGIDEVRNRDMRRNRNRNEGKKSKGKEE